MINTWSWHYGSAFVTNRGVFCDCAIQCLQPSRQSHLFSSKMLIEYSYLISFMLMEYELIKFSYYLCSMKQNQSLDTLISSWGFASLKTSDPQAECQDVAINEVLLVFSATLKVVHIYSIWSLSAGFRSYTPSCSGLLKGSISFILVFTPLADEISALMIELFLFTFRWHD